MARKNSYRYAGVDFVGARHGMLQVIRKADHGRSWWVCKCDCGKIVELQTFRFFEYKSCGCLEKANKANLAQHTRTHGMTETRLYGIWCGIKDRCYNPNIEHYDRYGGRGIIVCDEWKNSFEAFADWAYSAGYDERLNGKTQSIDRINVNGNYEPNNCKWVTQKEQMRNTTRTVFIEYHGDKIPLSAFCEEHGITYSSFVTRHIKRGFTAEELLRVWEYSQGRHDGFYSLQEASEHYGVGQQSIMHWIKAGKLKAEKVGGSWYIPYGQTISRREDRNELGQFLPGFSRPRGQYK